MRSVVQIEALTPHPSRPSREIGTSHLPLKGKAKPPYTPPRVRIGGSASYDITETQSFVMPAMDAVVHVTFVPVG